MGLPAVPLSAALPPDGAGHLRASNHNAVTQKSLLRFITCGSVDDGKSTLLGRLLYETGAIFDDQASALARDSAKFGTTGEVPDLALLVDGLAAEREQGITIDVAYRYFSTPRRAFIAADTPGHEQYTRNMATGASTADLAIILIDARKGLLPQTRRHSYVVSMIGVRHVIVAVNKMDLVGFSEDTFRAIEADYQALAADLGFAGVTVIPVSARSGDNVSRRSPAMAWYDGPSLLSCLEQIETGAAGLVQPMRFPVQWINRPHLDFRGLAGTLASGVVRKGDRVSILPQGAASSIARIVTATGDLDEAVAGQSVTLVLADEVDVSRGNVIVPEGSNQRPTRSLAASLLVLTGEAVRPGQRYLLKLGTVTVPARISRIHHAVDIHDYSHRPADSLAVNDIAVVGLALDEPVVATPYATCRDLGGFILIDPASNATVAMGTVTVAQAVAGEVVQTGIVSRIGRRWAPVLARFADARGLPLHLAIIKAASWRLASATLLGAGIYALTGNGLVALVAGLADATLRMVLREAHAIAWSHASGLPASSGASDLDIDGSGI